MDTLSSTAIRKVSRELHSLDNDPPEGIRLIANEESIADIQAWIKGPEMLFLNGAVQDGTPYEGGCFGVRIQLPSDYPESPPKCTFTTKIFHPNVSLQGDVCVSTLKKDWKQDLGLRHILLVIKCLLIVPNAESALNEEAGRQLLDRFDDYAKHARLMTSIHARSNTHLIFPPTASMLPGAGDTMIQDRAQDIVIGMDTSIPNGVLGVKRKLTEDFDEGVLGSDQHVRHQATVRGRTQSIFSRYPVSSGPIAPQASPQPWPLSLPTTHGTSASANNQILGKGPCLQEHHNLAKPQQIQLSDFKGLPSKMTGSSSATSQATLLQSTSVLPSSLGLTVTGPNLLADNINMAASSSCSGSIGLNGSGSGGFGRSGGGFSSNSSCKDHVGILTAVDRKRALRRL